MSPDTSFALAAEFPPVTGEQWRAAVDELLAGRDAGLSEDELARRYERQLVTTTYDGIAVQPLYSGTSADGSAEADGLPGFWPFRRGTTLLGGAPGGWDVRQVVDLDRVKGSAPTAALDELERGATSLLVRSAARRRLGPAEVDVDLLDAALDGVYLDLVPIALDSSLGLPAARALMALWERREIEPAAAGGVLGLDPIGAAASDGTSSDPEDLRACADLALACAERWPKVRSWVVDATRYHEAGASDVEELACALSTGVAYLRLLTEAGLDVAAALAQIEFRLAATADQFSTMAKLRASRRLWARVAQVAGAPEAGGQHQHALTSRAMLTRYDTAVNLLRNTTACFAAGVGGAGAITVEPHDLLVDSSPSELGRRMARNTQLLLLEESQLARVIDPGGGSWYLERLTDEMAQRAWSWFQEIEAAGGMAAALETRLVQDRIEETWTRRSERLAVRRETLVGATDFPNGGERIPPRPASSGDHDGRGTAGTAPGSGLPRRRYADDFETLRSRVDDYERGHGSRPAVALVRLGAASAFTARATYASSFFETAGLRTVDLDAGEGTDLGALSEAVSRSGAALACICSSDPVYEEMGASALQALTSAGLARTYAATRPGKLGDQLLEAGADELIWAGCDVLDALRRALDAAGVP